jgi:ABC-type dipeptide/oligopeptide/nickel transport system ATPase subunit
LIIGLSGPSGSGKTYSALELATGIQSVTGGDIHVVDTESKRALHYADYFKFIHTPFAPPFGPLDYMAAFQHCISKGAKIIIADSMTLEHDGEGGVLDQIEAFLTAKAGDDWEKRNRFLMLANAKPKAERKKLNQYIVQNGDVVWILCYRAQDKTKPLKRGQTSPDGEKILHLGWQPITTSPLVFEMTARFLLGPCSEGHPTLNPGEEAEKMMIKNPRQFAGWVEPDQQLSRDLGAKMAKWAAGDASAQPTDAKPAKKRDPVAGLMTILGLGQWPNAEARILSSLGKNHRSELDETDIDKLTATYKSVKKDAAEFDRLCPPLPAGGSHG